MLTHSGIDIVAFFQGIRVLSFTFLTTLQNEKKNVSTYIIHSNFRILKNYIRCTIRHIRWPLSSIFSSRAINTFLFLRAHLLYIISYTYMTKFLRFSFWSRRLMKKHLIEEKIVLRNLCVSSFYLPGSKLWTCELSNSSFYFFFLNVRK